MAVSAAMARRKLVAEETARLQAESDANAQALAAARARFRTTSASPAAPPVASPTPTTAASNPRKGGGTGDWQRDKAEAERAERAAALKARTANLLASTEAKQEQQEEDALKTRKNLYGGGEAAPAPVPAKLPRAKPPPPANPLLQIDLGDEEEPEFSDAELLEMVGVLAFPPNTALLASITP
jgi:hypothetical protein